MATAMPVRRRFEARPGPVDGLPGCWTLWDGLVGKPLSRLIVCDGEEEARHLAAWMNAKWRETQARRVEALASDDQWADYLEGIGG